MSKVSSPSTAGKQLVGPILSGNATEDRALWRLSLVLMEIAEKQQASTINIEPQRRFDVEDKVSRYTDQDNNFLARCNTNTHTLGKSP